MRLRPAIPDIPCVDASAMRAVLLTIRPAQFLKPSYYGFFVREHLEHFDDRHTLSEVFSRCFSFVYHNLHAVACIMKLLSVGDYTLVMKQTATNLVSMASTAPHAVGNLPDVLHQILDTDVTLSLWQRRAQTAITRELSNLQALRLSNIRCPTSLDSFHKDVSTLLR